MYFLTTGISYAAFSIFSKPGSVEQVKSPVGGSSAKFDNSLPRTEACPLNGALWPKPQREWWEKHRPLGVMIENHEESRPQSGLNKADVVYEAVAEGGITRFLAIFYCQDADPIGPIRSARTYFLDWISEYGDRPLYAHVGGANTPGPANALGQIEDYGWVGENDLNQFSVGFPTYWRDYERMGRTVATEHTVYSTTTKLWEIGAKRDLTEKDEKGKKWDANFEKWSFKDAAKETDRPASFSAESNFWQGYDAYRVKWEYDNVANSYKRINGGQPHIDKDDDIQLAPKNVVIIFTTEKNANDGYENNLHLLYVTKGEGKAIILQDGKAIEGKWQKKDRLGRTKFLNQKGKEIEFNPGQIWIQVLPIGTDIKFS